jgi:hypothetical protein
LKGSSITGTTANVAGIKQNGAQTIVQEWTTEANRLQNVLETATIKRASVATDVLGKRGRSMRDALLGGQTDAEARAELARGRLRAKLPD